MYSVTNDNVQVSTSVQIVIVVLKYALISIVF